MSKCFPHLDEELLHKVRGDSSIGASGGKHPHPQHEEEDLHLYEVSDTTFAVRTAAIGEARQSQATQQLAANAEDGDNIISRRLWLYLLDRQNITSSSVGHGQGQQVKWSQMSAQAIQGLAQQLCKGVYSVNGRRGVAVMW